VNEWLRGSSKLEVRRQAKLHLVGSFGKRIGRPPRLADTFLQRASA